MNKNNPNRKQTQVIKKNSKNHGNFQNFINSKTTTASKIRTIDTVTPPSTDNVSKLKDLRNRPNYFSNYIDNSYKQTKKIKLFELDSDEEKQTALTHHGQNIEELKNDFQNSDPGSEDDYVEKLQQKMMKQTNFGGFEQQNEGNEEERQKSKAEIYKEIIHKSKQMKYERQKLREENETKRLELDQGYSELVPLLTFKKLAIQKIQPSLVDDYLQLKKSLEAEEAIARPSKKIKKEKVSADEQIFNDNESSHDYQ